MISISSLEKFYINSHTQALKGVSFVLPHTGLVNLRGHSGSGKSTLLKIIAGFEMYDIGDITFNSFRYMEATDNEKNVFIRKNIGYISQKLYLIDNLTVYENLQIAKECTHDFNDQDIQYMLKKMNCLAFLNRKISNLSSGEKQRVELARILLSKPKVLLLDEPFANIDQASSSMMIDILKELSKQKLILLVDHHYPMFEAYFDRYITLKQGTIIEDVTITKSVDQSEEKITKEFEIQTKQNNFWHLFLYWMKSHKLNQFIYMSFVFILCVMVALAVILTFRVEYTDDIDLSSRIMYIQNRNRTPLSEVDQAYFEELTDQIKVVPNELYTITGEVEMIEDEYNSYKLYSANLLFLEDVNGRLPKNRNEIVCDISLYRIGDQVNMSYQGVVDQYTIVGVYRSIHSNYETNIYVYDALLRESYEIIQKNILDYINNETPLIFYSSQGNIDLSLEITDQSQSILYIENTLINNDDFVTYQVGQQVGYIDHHTYHVVTESHDNKLVLTKDDFESLFSSYVFDYEYIIRSKNRSDIELFASMVDDSTYRIIDVYQSEQSNSSVFNNFFITVLRSIIFIGIVAVMTIIYKFIVKKYTHKFKSEYHYYQICGVKNHIIHWIVRCNFLLYVILNIFILILVTITLNMTITDFNFIHFSDILLITIWILLATHFFINNGLKEVAYD